jgi:hypothetical protein
VRKYCMKFHVDNNMMAALSNGHEEECELDYMFNVTQH